MLGWDQFYLINCYRNIYPGCSSSSSQDVFMHSGCVHTVQTGPVVEGGGRRRVMFPSVCVCGGGGDAMGVDTGVSGFAVFVVV